MFTTMSRSLWSSCRARNSCTASLFTTVLLSLATCQIVYGQSYGQNYGQQQYGQQDSRQQFVNHHMNPRFLQTPQNITAGPGERAVLRCKVDNLGTKTVVWKKRTDAHPLTIGLFTFVGDSRITVDYNQRNDEWSLIIQDIKPADEGVYQCQISTKLEQRKVYDIKLNVKTVQVSGTEFVSISEPVKLMCNATGKPDPPHDVEWFKGGHKINSNAMNGVLITKKIETKMLISVLVISGSRKEDEGDYVCRSSNMDHGSIKVHVLTAYPRPRSNDQGSTQQHRVDNGSSSYMTSSPLMTSLITMVTIVIQHHKWMLDIR